MKRIFLSGKKRLLLLLLLLMAGSLVFALTRDDTYPVYAAGSHYDPATQKFSNAEPQRAPIDNISALWAMLAKEQQAHPPAPLPVIAPDWAQFHADDRSRFVWLGHSSLLLRIGGNTVLVDPVFAERVAPLPGMMKCFQPPPVALADLPPADVVLISHNHYDHLEEASIRQLAGRANHFIAPLGVGVLLQKWGVPAQNITELDWWQQFEYGGITYTAVPARHDSGRTLTDRFKTLWAGYVLQHADEQIYYSGDSSQGAHFDDIARRFGHFDLAFIENGQYDYRWPDNHLFPEQTAAVAAQLNVRRLVPVHWGAYPMALHSWNEPILRLMPAAAALNVATITPKLGQVFDADSQSEAWYRYTNPKK